MTKPLLQLQNVRKRYANGSPVLDGLSLDLGEHDSVAFIGPRGCGKSTILRLVAGLTPVTSGEINLGDAPVKAPSLDSAFVFSEPALLPWRTVEKNLRLPLQLLGKSRDEQTATARDMMKMWEIGHVGGRYPLQLTPGNKMRAALARAMITKPKILLLDEPFAALDAITRNKVSAELMKVREKLPFATLHVTHSAAEAAYLAKRVVVLSANPGRIQEIIEIPQEHPRGLEWRESTDFQDAVSRIRAALNQAKEVKQ